LSLLVFSRPGNLVPIFHAGFFGVLVDRFPPVLGGAKTFFFFSSGIRLPEASGFFSVILPFFSVDGHVFQALGFLRGTL